MSRTKHLTQRQDFGEDPKPHRHQPRTTLTKTRDFLPSVPRPKNEGTRRVPSGGYAASRRAHAAAKKLGKRRLRRHSWFLP
jgi:hypothetical protein